MKSEESRPTPRRPCAVGRGAITPATPRGSLFARMPCGSLTAYAMMSPARTSRSPVAPATTPAPEMAISSTVDALECTGTSVSYTHLRAHETRHDLVCRLLL